MTNELPEAVERIEFTLVEMDYLSWSVRATFGDNNAGFIPGTLAMERYRAHREKSEINDEVAA